MAMEQPLQAALAAPRPKPFYYYACATAMVPVAPEGMVATPMPTTKHRIE